MQLYIAYLLDTFGRIFGPSMEFECVDDAAAIKCANLFRGLDVVEVWQSNRLVARIEANGEASHLRFLIAPSAPHFSEPAWAHA